MSLFSAHFNPEDKNPPEVGYALTKPKPGGCRFHQVLRCSQWRNKSLPQNMIQMEIFWFYCFGEARVANQHPCNCIMKLEWYQVMLPTLPQAVWPYFGCFDVAIKWIPNLTIKTHLFKVFSEPLRQKPCSINQPARQSSWFCYILGVCMIGLPGPILPCRWESMEQRRVKNDYWMSTCGS